MRTYLLCLLTVASLAAGPNAGAADVALVGQAVTDIGQCLVLDGFGSTTANRSRWLAAFWDFVAIPPVCNEADAHVDPNIVCLEVTVGEAQERTVHIAATGPSKSNYLFKIVDRPAGTDAFGVLRSAPISGPCGAGTVTTRDVISGGFVVASA